MLPIYETDAEILQRMPPIAGGSDDDPPAGDPPPVEDAAPPAPPAPAYMTQADFDRVNAENRAHFEGLIRQQQEMLQSFVAATRRPAADPHTPTADPTTWSDEQLQQAVDEGRMSQIQATRALTARENRRFAAEHLEPLRAQGGAAISETAKTLAKLSTDESGKPLMPHFKRFEKEIDEVVKNYGPNAVLTARHYQDAYRYVVGGHVDELAEERREAAVRSASAPKPEITPSGARNGRQAAGSGEIPTPAEALGEREARLMDEKGGPDAFCKRLGYAGGWKQYYKEAVATEVA